MDDDNPATKRENTKPWESHNKRKKGATEPIAPLLTLGPPTETKEIGKHSDKHNTSSLGKRIKN